MPFPRNFENSIDITRLNLEVILVIVIVKNAHNIMVFHTCSSESDFDSGSEV